MLRTCHEKGLRMFGGMSDEDGYGWEKEGETKVKVNGQCKCGHEGKGMSLDETPNRAAWRHLVRSIDPTYKWENMR